MYTIKCMVHKTAKLLIAIDLKNIFHTIRERMFSMIYKTSGVCSTEIDIELDDECEVIKSVKFKNGCAGNTSGLSKLLVGMKADDVIEKLEGTTCGRKSTSCPDQLAKALKNWRVSK